VPVVLHIHGDSFGHLVVAGGGWVPDIFRTVLSVITIIGSIAGAVTGVAGAASAVAALRTLNWTMATAIVTAGAGARGAYEAGVLSVVVPKLLESGEREIVLVGTSAGAINTAIMAGAARGSARDLADKLCDTWRQLDVSKVFKLNVLSVAAFCAEFAGLRWLRDYALLDTRPLRRTAESGGAVEWAELSRSFHDSWLKAAGVVATEVSTGKSIVFVQGLGELPKNNVPRGIEYRAVDLASDHVLASAAIPIAFPSIDVQKSGWFVDGGVRLNTPISPGIDLLAKVSPGPNRMIIVSTDPDPRGPNTAPVASSRPDVIDEASSILHSVFVDRVAEDVRSLRRINAITSANGAKSIPDRRADGGQTFDVIEHCYFGPLTRGPIRGKAGEIFRSKYGPLSFSIFNPLSRALGNEGPSHDELLSFLLFDTDYLTALVQMGQADAQRLSANGLQWIAW
jgi:NTE family protein